MMGWKGDVAAAGAGAIVAGLAVGVGQGWRHDAAISAMVAKHARVMQGYADAAYRAQEQAREEEQRRVAAVESIRNEANEQVYRPVGDRNAVRAELHRLRGQYDALRNGAGSGKPAIASRGEAASDAIGMFTHMLERLGDIATFYADTAARSWIAGLACERAYEALR